MKSKLAAVLLASATLGAGPAIFAPPASALAQVEVSFEFFRDSLSPYGEWIEVGDYGLCWRPTDVAADWAPYTDGYWSYTDAGWTWVSYEDFGAVAYHYGRWVVVEDEGWVWVPDYEWGPAWVSWRNNDDYVGWAPLPPEAHWEPDRGFSVWVDTTYDIGPSYYNFCAVEDFGAPVIREVIVERPRNFFLIGATFNITNISINRDIGVPFCGGPRFDFIRERSRRRVPTLKLVRETNITNIENNTYINKTVNKTVIRNGGGRRGLRAAVEGNQLIVPAPKVRRIDKAQAVAEMKPKRRVAANRVNRGWKGVKDENQRRELKEKMAKQTEGRRPDNARAKPVDVADLKPVPEKADPNAPSPVAGRGRDRDRDRDKKREGKSGEVAETQKPERPDREERPGNGKRAENDRKEKRDKEEPAGVAGRGPLKPFNGAEREERKEQRKGEEASPDRVPAPMVTETPGADREGKRKQAAAEEKDREERQSKAKRASEDAQRQAAERRRQKMYSDEADRLKKRERNENAVRQEDNNRQREAAAKQQQEAAAARRQEAAQQEQRQQRRQQQMQQAESQQRRQERPVQDQQRMQQLQRQQAARQQEQRAIQQQRQGQAERQMQMQRQAERQQQQRMQQQQQRQPQRQQFQQQRPQQQQPQQFRRQGGGGGGEARGGGGGGRNRVMSPEEAAERRGR